ncbi:MAG TPA: hypothetical protein VEC57_18435 [Candidatus Limnocylindrales bacterium]|nr:hypothetical protein [Candidatus Limnocylindrales bacterium]
MAMAISWESTGAFALMGAGAALVLRNVVAWRRAAAMRRDPERALWLARGFRTGIVGLCAIGAGAGWHWNVAWLVVLSLIIAGEELLETTVLVMALRDGQRQDAARADAQPLSQKPPQS